MELYAYLFAGIVIYILLGLTTFNKQTPTLGEEDTIKQYFDMNKWNLLAGLILGVVCILFLSAGRLGFLKSLGFDILSNPESAFVLGIVNQWLLQRLRQIFFKTGVLETDIYSNKVKKNRLKIPL